MDIITTLETAREALSKVSAINMMIADIDGLCGHGIPYASSRKSGGHSDPTSQAFERLSKLREQLKTANEKAVTLYNIAMEELESLPDEDVRRILFLRHLKKLKWHEIAQQFGVGYSADMLKQKHSRFRRGLQGKSVFEKEVSA